MLFVKMAFVGLMIIAAAFSFGEAASSESSRLSPIKQKTSPLMPASGPANENEKDVFPPPTSTGSRIQYCDNLAKKIKIHVISQKTHSFQIESVNLSDRTFLYLLNKRYNSPFFMTIDIVMDEGRQMNDSYSHNLTSPSEFIPPSYADKIIPLKGPWGIWRSGERKVSTVNAHQLMANIVAGDPDKSLRREPAGSIPNTWGPVMDRLGYIPKEGSLRTVRFGVRVYIKECGNYPLVKSLPPISLAMPDFCKLGVKCN